MIYIVEGPDGSGKTTLVKKIQESNRNVRVMHFGAPTTDEEALNYYKVYAKAIASKDENEVLVFDRSWYSDMVYGPVMRNREEMSQEHADMLSAMVVASGGGIIIYCTAPIKTLWSRCMHRGETYIESQVQLQQISVGYANIMEKYVKYLPVVRYDTAARW